MKIMVKIENSISGKSLSLYVGNKRKVNKLMINLIEAGFTVNYEPRYISGNYEGCFLCEDGNVIKICCRKHAARKFIIKDRVSTLCEISGE